MGDLPHIDAEGRSRMVDVSDKEPTRRVARAEGRLVCERGVIDALLSSRTPKGDPLEAARLAGVMAAKRTSELIPLCHALPLDHARVEVEVEDVSLRIVAEVATRAPTGVEMEALTAVAVAGLTLYDMLKALSKTMRLTEIRLLAKSGGRSGDFAAEDAP